MKKNTKNKEKGFTMIELLIVVALIAIIYSTTLANYDGMNKKIDLKNAVYMVALTIREAQIYGINKKIVTDNPNNVVPFSDNDPYPYGTFLSKNNNLKNKIIIFRDLSSPINFRFDPNGNEIEKAIKLNNGIHISRIIADNNNSWVDLDKVNIMFKRPNPDAIIKSGTQMYSRVQIEITNKNNKYKGCIDIGSAGDMSILNKCTH